MTLNKSKTLTFKSPFATAVIGSPEIADLLPMTDHTLYVQGKNVGTTNISVFGAEKRLVAVVDLEVAPDTATLRSQDRGDHRRAEHRRHQREWASHPNWRGERLGVAARAVDLARGLAAGGAGGQPGGQQGGRPGGKGARKRPLSTP